MKDNIYTIPVMDAFRTDCECPCCLIKYRVERDALKFILSPAYMEEDIRQETNRLGFCQQHYSDIFKGENALGVALMLHTHMREFNKRFERNALDYLAQPKKQKNFFAKIKADTESPLKDGVKKTYMMKYGRETTLVTDIHETLSSCYVCRSVEKTFDRYMDTFFMMWEQDAELRGLVTNGKGFCMQHFALLVGMSEEKMRSTDQERFYHIILDVQLESMKRVEEDIDWLINKFDYRYKDHPWANSKDSVPRGILKVSSEAVGDVLRGFEQTKE